MGSDADVRHQILSAAPRLIGLALSLTRCHHAAEDLVQETFTRAWAHRDRFEPGTNARAWLFTILRKAFYTQASRARRDVADADDLHATRLIALSQQDDHLVLLALLAVIPRLPTDQREVLILFAFERLSQEEVAEACGTPAGTVKSRVSRARTSLARAIGMDDTEDIGQDGLTKAAFQTR